MVFSCDRLNNLTSSISVLAITIGLLAGQSASDKSLAQTSTTPPPAGVTSINGLGASTVNTLFVGTGETNPCPFGSKGSWFNVFGVGNPPSLNTDLTATTNNCPVGTYGPVVNNDTFRYAAVGSGAGITAFFNQTVPPASPGPTILAPVSFAATDDPLTGTQIEQTVTAGTGKPNSGKAIQVPVVGVGITLSYNRTGLTIPAAGLKFSRNSYCGILKGTITNWNDSRIRADNGNAVIAVNLPIKVVRRSDNSGSTFVLSTHLNTVCKTAATSTIQAANIWDKGVGSVSTSGTVPPTPPANTVVWPATFLSATGGGGVATAISANNGAIGYVDSATRLAKSLPAALLQNKANAYVGPTTAGIQSALSVGTIVKYGTAPANRLIRIDNLADPNTATAYPISAATYALFYDVYQNSTTGNLIATHIRTLINWALANPPQTVFPSSNPTPDQIAINRGYAPLPNNIKTVARTVVNTCVNTATGPSPCTP
ncbi:MAG: substrate-binding domain-containing protein [Nostoc sp. NMS1]|uniref:substrate-binding domain-containing protein n=1 Tax=unclassified Nostoc TaxID=2593658 RepID=UPI0025CF3256|nr:MULTISPECIES: substrate-binding domain-containing protein [unclassified Nostoc]MBN3910677.1 substrate-binding domain-containing protein [Nostoc sp. NMS1]MBN3993120.1 substrate-binding domain-containing protein [Nostoc sp. NMS2]